MGILICGLNGSGKTTLGKALAEKTGFYYIDSEDLFFPAGHADAPFADPRTKEEAAAVLSGTVCRNRNFIFSSVKGDYGDAIISLLDAVICVEAPKAIRMQRIRERSFRKLGSRMLPGGDLYEKEEAFFAMAAGRDEPYVEEWLLTVRCPVLRVDGTKPAADNAALITEWLQL